MDLEVLEKILGDISEIQHGGDLEVNISGGEPFLLDNLPDFVRLARRKFPNSTVSVSTNGTVFRSIFAAKMLEHTDYLNISLDGREFDHDRNRGSGLYAKTIKNIFRYSEIGYSINVNLLAYSGNSTYLLDLKKYLQVHLPVENIRLVPLMLVGRATENVHNFFPESLPNVSLHSKSADKRCVSCHNNSSLSIYPDGSTHQCYTRFIESMIHSS